MIITHLIVLIDCCRTLKIKRNYLHFQLFSNATADGLTYYSQEEQKEPDKEIIEFKGCEPTIKFTLQMNNMFDPLNRSYKKEGIRKNSPDFEVGFFFLQNNFNTS